jgi:NADH:ubiquinone oxidoreductase subunit F (NADH-binding)
MFGLPAIANAVAKLATPGRHRSELELVQRWAGTVERRGACNHPDGTVRFVRSALSVFADEVERHRAGRCTGTSDVQVLPTPNAPMSAKDWR